ncbi:MAG: DEAD/DEAH box helicase [Saprospiraceae bacterium]|nr:DEAD/DEAH box helicase [Saprospiraceae bacterium]MBP6694570.1 DEAD/DEAH box helicase [Saprospiraceae bacterium]
MHTFSTLGLDQEILRSIEEIGYEKPTEIQEKAIPILLGKRGDFIGLAATGTGKTAAFGLPLIQYTDTNKKHISSLILAPTRELAQQIAKELLIFGKHKKGLRIELVYGGAPITNQIRNVKKNMPHILVATPGRLKDLIDRKTVFLDELEFLVLDEADEMLNMGFQEAVDEILEFTPESKVTWLFSATMPSEIRKIINTYMKTPDEIKIHSETKTNVNIDHKYIYVHRSDKEAALKRVLDYLTDFYGVVFCKTKMDTQELAEYLEREGYRAEPLHGDLSQNQRDAVMAKFRNKTTPILVATDVAARGIDVDNLTHVVHYSLPDNPEYYTHRSGRTARAGKKGTSLAIVTPQDIGRIRFFEKIIGVEITHIKVPLQSQMYNKKIEKFTEKIMNEDTVELTDEMVEKAMEAFQFLTKEDLVKKILAIEFDKLHKKVERDDLNILGDDRRKRDKTQKDRISSPYDRDPKKDRDRGRDRVRERGGDKDKPREGERPREEYRTRPNMVNYFINLGKIDDVYPVTLIEFLSSFTGITKKSIGDIYLHKKHSIIQVDKSMTKRLEESARHLKFKGRKIIVKQDSI